MTWIAGADGCESKWCVVLLHVGTGELRARIVPTFSELLTIPENPSIVAIDIPIGLPEFTPAGGRSCERQARRALGLRASCVFNAVGRRTLKASSHSEANHVSLAGGGIRLSIQAWGLAAKLREADEAMTPERQRIIHEVHPEVSFWAMNRGAPMSRPKKTPEGARDRTYALIRSGFPADIPQPSLALKARRDDILDACAAAWSARRVLEGRAGRLPTIVERDSRGLDMAIWY